MKVSFKIIAVLLLVVLTGLTTSCDNPNSPTIPSILHDKELNTDNSEYKSKHLYIKDETKYEKSFVDALKSFSTGQDEYITLIDDFLTVNKEQYYLPSEIESVKRYIFSKVDRSRQINLILIKHNFSGIEFNLKISDGEKITLNKAGVAALDSSFFLGSEAEEDEETGESYFVTSYNQEDKDGYIYIKVGEDESGLLGATVQLKDGKDMPTLILRLKQNTLRNSPLPRMCRSLSNTMPESKI